MTTNSLIRLKLSLRRNAKELRMLDLMSPSAITSSGTDLMRRRILRSRDVCNENIDVWKSEMAAEKLKELWDSGICPIHGTECPELQKPKQERAH